MISIIIPVYNAANYLPKMLDSIICQSYSNIEIIMVNDGSTDTSSLICHEYARKYGFIKVYDRENCGVSVTRNFGVEKAQGEFIWFMDSDDELAPNALELAVEKQQKHDSDIVIGGMNFCFTQENTITPKVIDEEIVFNACDFKYVYKKLFLSNYVSSLCNKLIRRNLIIEHKISMNESLSMYEDYIYCMDVLLKSKKTVCIKEVFYNYQLRNSDSLSHRYRDGISDMFCILYNKIAKYISILGNDSEQTRKSLNDLIIYIGYECVKNEARHKYAYSKVKALLHGKVFHDAMLSSSGSEGKYRVVHQMMKHRMALVILLYLKLTKKIR